MEWWFTVFCAYIVFTLFKKYPTEDKFNRTWKYAWIIAILIVGQSYLLSLPIPFDWRSTENLALNAIHQIAFFAAYVGCIVKIVSGAYRASLQSAERIRREKGENL